MTNEAIGRRLTIFREAIGYPTKTAFAKLAEIGKAAISDWENGRKHLGIQSAIKLCRVYPELTLDWLYMGHLESIKDQSLRNRMREIQGVTP